MSILDGTEPDTESINGGGRDPDVFDRMEADHKRLRFLLDRLRQSRDAAPQRPRLFDLFCDALESYGAASEQSLYAEMLARADTDNKWPARHAVAVHDMSEFLTFELSGMEMTGEDWRAGIRQLSEYLEDHFRVEASEVFPLARTLLDREEAARLGEKYAQEKRDWIARFARVPATSQPAPVKHSQIADMLGAVIRPYTVTPPFTI
jgi:hypothetical protein